MSTLCFIELLPPTPVWATQSIIMNYGFNYVLCSTVKDLIFPCRPISCYKADLTKEITGDVELEEELVTCNQVEDVCFGRVILTVSNKTDTGTSQGYIQVGITAQPRDNINNC